MRPFLYPSNSGKWTGMLAYFVTTMVSEMSRHVGRSLVHRIYDSDVTDSIRHQGMAPFEAPLSVETVRFLSGYLASLVIEGLYGKNGMMSQFCSQCLKNLVGIDPTLGRVAIPFLLGALDPGAVNQSHQAPVAMQTLNLLMKPLLFPCPVMLPYVSDLLRLSLPGVDPNDNTKTCVTLSMWTGLLSWLPVQSSYRAPAADSYPPAFLSIVNSVDQLDPAAEALYRSFQSPARVQAAYDSLVLALEEWVPCVMDRIFAVVEAQEKVDKKQKAHHVVGFIAEFFGQLVSACSSDLRQVVEDKVVDFFKSSTPLNAAKLCSKIASCITETGGEHGPASMRRLLETLVTADVLGNSCSAEVLAYRLRVVAGVVRYGGGDSIVQCLDLLTPLVGPTFTSHTDRDVRDCAAKLLKDLLRGATSQYVFLSYYSSEPFYFLFCAIQIVWSLTVYYQSKHHKSVNLGHGFIPSSITRLLLLTTAINLSTTIPV